MGTPVNLKSVDAQQSTGAGKSTQTLGHYHLALAVVVRNLDSGNDTVTVDLQGSPDGDHWGSISGLSLQESDLNQNDDSGDYTAFTTVSGAFAPYIRARVAEYSDAADGDLEVDAWVMASAWPEAGVRAGRDNG